METCCTLFHDSTGELTKDLELNAGDDAADCQWIDVDVNNPTVKMYASHGSFLNMTLDYVKVLELLLKIFLFCTICKFQLKKPCFLSYILEEQQPGL